MKCEKCGETIKTECKDIDGRLLCFPCFQDSIDPNKPYAEKKTHPVSCNTCGTPLTDDEGETTIHGVKGGDVYYCMKCSDNATCHKCNEVIKEEDKRKEFGDGSIWCLDCAPLKCKICGLYTEPKEHFCNSCKTWIPENFLEFAEKYTPTEKQIGLLRRYKEGRNLDLISLFTKKEKALDAVAVQPLPRGKGVEVTPLVLADINYASGGLVARDLLERSAEGVKKYGEPLTTENGRNALVDAYQEVLDLLQYLRQYVEENDSRSAEIRDIHSAYEKAHQITKIIRQRLTVEEENQCL